jgi:hypothetical protein
MSIALLVGASFLTFFPVTAGGVLHPWFDRMTLLPFAMGLACLFLLLHHEKKAKKPILALHIFQNRSLATALLVSFVTGVILWCLFFYPTIFFQRVWQHIPLESAVDGFSFTANRAFTELGNALLIDRLSSCRWLLVAAFLLATVGSGVSYLAFCRHGHIPWESSFCSCGHWAGHDSPCFGHIGTGGRECGRRRRCHRSACLHSKFGRCRWNGCGQCYFHSTVVKLV